VAIVVVSAITLVIRAGDRHTGGRDPASAPTTSGASSSTDVVANQPRRAVITPVPTTAPTAAPTAAPIAAPTDSARAPAADVVSPTRRYTLAVGEFADLQVALDERDRIRELSGMDAWVISVDDLGPHRIVLGVFGSKERAQAAAKMLIKSRTLEAATVAPLPKRGARQ
jgi:cell division protein FtsN